ncbi:toxin-antitoxin system YwqK family antitoxin [Pleionea sediminis]|uniref:toxin-antitoxin system YwqK family antitoxin n=1 Tax=Pleionea sediminis TaxID=2569479 RepID=UPI001184ECB8|nr:hypothetical protein [Pleionea sediminis]
MQKKESHETLYVILISLNLLAGCGSKSPAKSVLEFENINGLIHLKGDSSPFTGINENFYPNGQIWFRIPIKNGVPHGVSKFWYENGSPKSEIEFDNGKPTDNKKQWDENGILIKD